ncbi:gluconokinase [Colwellia echini]|uniref:Gluconokinase n=1 Tax=Colwellia echini TaxID=1982103 RepID=A0ABY3MSU3_9GAMM|nr:gluconokinase [Colwellia echini]TYK64268.1 gluconokinase [Colwellia echini]
MIYIVMGVSGCGKSTVGAKLAEQLSVPFYDADDYHFPESIAKMAGGTALTDEDRKPWLNFLAKKIVEWQAAGGCVLACSSLKQVYRDLLSSTTEGSVKFVYLQGDKDLLLSRLTNRESHFMGSTLLESQLQTLEVPLDAITVSVALAVDDIIAHILKKIN